MKQERTKGKNLGSYIAQGAKGLAALTALGCIAGTAAIIGYWGQRTFTDAPETYENFSRYEGQGYEPVSADIPTKGDVIRVKLLANEDYTETKNPDGSITLKGPFEYEIEKESTVLDKYGNEIRDFWEDVRKGTVTLEKEATKE